MTIGRIWQTLQKTETPQIVIVEGDEKATDVPSASDAARCLQNIMNGKPCRSSDEDGTSQSKLLAGVLAGLLTRRGKPNLSQAQLVIEGGVSHLRTDAAAETLGMVAEAFRIGPDGIRVFDTVSDARAYLSAQFGEPKPFDYRVSRTQLYAMHFLTNAPESRKDATFITWETPDADIELSTYQSQTFLTVGFDVGGPIPPKVQSSATRIANPRRSLRQFFEDIALGIWRPIMYPPMVLRSYALTYTFDQAGNLSGVSLSTRYYFNAHDAEDIRTAPVIVNADTLLNYTQSRPTPTERGSTPPTIVPDASLPGASRGSDSIATLASLADRTAEIAYVGADSLMGGAPITDITTRVVRPFDARTIELGRTSLQTEGVRVPDIAERTAREIGRSGRFAMDATARP